MQGPWDNATDCIILKGIDPDSPSDWMDPAGDGNSLHFTVAGNAGYTFVPYFELQVELCVQQYNKC